MGTVVAALVAAALAWTVPVALGAQQQFDLFVAAIDDRTGRPATDLTAGDLVVTEQGRRARVVRVTRYSVPVRLTVLVDNGMGLLDARGTFAEPLVEGPAAGLPPRADRVPIEPRGVQEALVHYRRGLQALVETLPPDLAVEVIALSPNPRWLARASADRVQLLRSVQLLTPEDLFPSRFTDGLVEYTKRLDRELRSEQADDTRPFVPVLVVLGSTGLDGSQPRRDDVTEMLESMVVHGVRTHFAMLTRHAGPLAVNTGSQVFVATAVRELTGGDYVPLAVPNRATTLLEEWGERIAYRHRAGTNQYRVTIQRPGGVTGPIRDLAMFVDREGYSGVVTADGRLP